MAVVRSLWALSEKTFLFWAKVFLIEKPFMEKFLFKNTGTSGTYGWVRAILPNIFMIHPATLALFTRCMFYQHG